MKQGIAAGNGQGFGETSQQNPGPPGSQSMSQVTVKNHKN